MVIARFAVVSTLLVLSLAACASSDGDAPAEHIGETSEALTAHCTANVVGHGAVDVEKVYLPDVVHCENGGAPLESLKAQAIAARTYLYYKLETSSTITDGQGDQVFSCGSHAGALEKQAVAETAGLVLRYNATTIAAFFVAGGSASPPACHDSSSSTSGDVTYNAGKSGNGITQTPLGLVDPSNLRNRGCMSQLGSRCLANEGKKADAILKFYYGDDIAITGATGPCVPPAPSADAGVDGATGVDAATVGDGGGSGGGGAARPRMMRAPVARASGPRPRRGRRRRILGRPMPRAAQWQAALVVRGRRRRDGRSSSGSARWWWGRRARAHARAHAQAGRSLGESKPPPRELQPSPRSHVRGARGGSLRRN